ncbi:cell wall metabolism sensor histidine kinase WalK [Sporosarcina sp. Te-1]|uniref:sensor histidine kinase n=1 Tax=Sporosarcina sp. Te-1 TaxID=2818390 RepID=UPI001A9E9C01|nr:HAMP domain-containing sensor histidine kinase [Sporosarcina sp. Te-1]QTD43407.1 two-component sensor histidine kinase [Sporosarcina sp. Te-1]
MEVKRIAGFLTGAASLLASWSLAFWITSWIYNAMHWSPPELIRQLITSLLGMFLFGCGMYLISKIKFVQDRHEKFLSPIIQAMRMMAEGNFSIDLTHYRNQFKGREHPYTKIIDSVNHMADRLGEMEEMRQEFISNVSHEIQSPLTSISGFAHALKNENLTLEERNHYLQIIETESLRLSKLSDNLLKLTTLESDHIPVELKSYRLDHQLRRIILASEPQWAEKELEMDILLDTITITADRDLMEQVWINLLHNSIKFTPQGGTITVRAAETDDHHVAVQIRDTGIGMGEETRMHVFERFYKADQSRNRNAEGNGLGLPIVKKIVDLHKGSIQVRSEFGEGTEVTVVLH